MRYQGRNHTGSSYSRTSAEKQKVLLKPNGVTIINIPVNKSRNKPNMNTQKNETDANANKNKVRVANFRAMALLVVLFAAAGSVIFIFIYLSGPSARVVEKISLFACTGIASVATIVFDYLGIVLDKDRKKKPIMKKAAVCFAVVIFLNGAVYGASVIKEEKAELPPSPPPTTTKFFDFKNPEPFGSDEETKEAMLNTFNGVAWEYQIPDDLATVNMTNSEALCALMPEYSTEKEVKYWTLKNKLFANKAGIYAKARQDYNTGKITRDQWKDVLEKIINAAEELERLIYAKNMYDHDLNRQIGLRHVDASDLYVQSNDLKNAMYAIEKGIQQVLLSVFYMRKSGSVKADMHERLSSTEMYYFDRLCNEKYELGEYVYREHVELYIKYEMIRNAVVLLLKNENFSRIEDLH